MSGALSIQMFDLPKRRKGEGRAKPARAGYQNVLICLPVELVAAIKASARATCRSMTAEVNVRLKACFANESIDEHGVIVVHSPSPLK